MTVFRRPGFERDGAPAAGTPADRSTMADRADRGPILVAVDGQAVGWNALEWAAAEASERTCPLRIISVFTWLPGPTAFAPAAILTGDPGARANAELIVAEAADRARDVDPTLRITSLVGDGSLDDVVLRAGRDHALIVLGQARSARSTEWLRASPTWQTVRQSPTPVAVIRLTDRIVPGPSAGRVVVGVGGSRDPSAVVGYAFRSALRRRAGLTIVHARPTAADGGASSENADSPDAAFNAALVQLPTFHAAFPEVDVRMRIVAGPIRAALVAESAGAALVVLGSARGRRLPCAHVPSVAHSVARLAGGPVTIV